jgi:phosphoglycerol transferase MdoB-like AlkP superfamily enzyme
MTRSRLGLSGTFVLSATALLAIGCQQPPAPPYDRAFAISVHAPGMLTSFHEITVPVTLTNTGSQSWDPRKTKLSYHWLWLVPREILKRSRTVPYHEGIRTDLVQAVAPNARASLEGRLLAPSWPGVYWLQWDMVEEGVNWFSQVSPRQPRQLVVVFPSAAEVFSPVPLVVAIAGFVAAGLLVRGRLTRPWAVSLAAVADIFWLVAVLLSKPVVLAGQVLLEPTRVAYWLMVVTAVMLPIVLALVLSRRARAWALFVCGLLGTLVILADVVYYRFFGDLWSMPALLAAHQTGHVIGTIRSLLTPELLWLIVDLPIAAWLVIRLASVSSIQVPRTAALLVGITAVAAIAVVGYLWSAPQVLAFSQMDQMFRDRAVAEQLGPYGFHAYDTWNYVRTTLLRPRATESQIENAAEWFRRRGPMRAGSPGSFGAARGKNLIVIQVESLQDFVVDYEVDGQEVMPHLRRWTEDSLRFVSVTDQTAEGRTSDAEFSTLVSLLPLDHGAVAFRYPGNHYVGLPRVLREHDYATLSAVAFEPGFWNRQVMHPSYGFQQSLFEPDFDLTEQIGWGLNDHDFLQQMVPRLEKLPRPFCAWLITLSLHHPFEGFPDRHKVLKLGTLERTPFGNYLHTMRFFDKALDDFKAALTRDGLLNDSVLAVFGDHDAGFAREPLIAQAIGVAPTEAAWSLADRVPLFVRLPGSQTAELASNAIPTTAGQTDFAPTWLALLGIDASSLPWVGRNLLGQADESPVPRPYGDWLDRTHLFLSGTSAATRVCYALTTGGRADVAACSAANELARQEREISHLVITDDLQQQLRAVLAP